MIKTASLALIAKEKRCPLSLYHGLGIIGLQFESMKAVGVIVFRACFEHHRCKSAEAGKGGLPFIISDTG